MSSTAALSLRHYLAYALLCAIWGSTWMAIRVVVLEVPPLWAAAVRFVIAAIILAALAALQRASLPKSVKQWRDITILGVTIMAIPFGLLFWAEQYVSSSLTALLYTSSPLVVSMLTPLVTGRKVPRSAVFSMVIAAGGIGVLFQSQLSASPRAMIGGAAILLAVTTSAWSALFAKKNTLDVSPVVSACLQLIIGAVLLFAGSAVLESGQGLSWSAKVTAALLFLAVFGSAVAFATYYWLLRKMHPYQLSTISLVVPLVAIAEGAILLQEPVPITMLIAAIVVLGAVGMVLRAQNDEPVGLKLGSEPWDGDNA
ncbi:MAG TPA: EamA family transporter [Terriglobales bacterium]|nr:EamA family transporter [Terriglobales bacterium]